ncbi:MAG: TAXI family TRAP transporter solute-binding subunit [Geminicoccaceae bacterium]
MNIAKRSLALAAALTMGALAAKAEVDNQLAIAIGTPGSESFTFGTELWAMSQIALMPMHKIALASKEVAADEDRLSLLQKREVEAALVYGRVPNAYDDDVRAIMALWPEGISSEDADPVQFLVHKDVGEESIYLLTKAMFEHTGFFKNAHASLGIGSTSVAMTGLDIPLHAGAYRYYRENGGLDEAVAAAYWSANREADVSTFRNFDDASLEADEIEQIAAACRHALEVGALSAVLGDLDNTGCEAYQDRLMQKQDVAEQDEKPAMAVSATSVRPSSGGAVEDLFATPVGRGGPAIRWEPSTSAANGDDDRTPARVIRQPVM